LDIKSSLLGIYAMHKVAISETYTAKYWRVDF